METMETLTEYAQYILECSKQNPASLLKTSSTSGKGKSLDQKLLDLFLEESAKQEEDKNLDNASHLLGKLLKRERLNCLVLSLYPGNEGYSLMLRARSGVESETIKLPYEESEVLEYIDAAELPPFLLDLLEKAQVNVFYSGCVIVEVRDYRRSAPGCYDTHYVLLRPSAQSMLCDVASLAAEFGGGSWTQDDLHQLEGELLLGTAEPLCLDPSPAVAMVATELTRQQKMFNEPSLRRAMKKHTQVALNRKRKLAQGPAPKELRLLDFLHKRRDKSKTPAKTLKSVDTWKQRSVNLSIPQELELPENYFKVVERPQSPSENLILVEEHRLERDPNQEHRMLAVISVYRQRLADGFVGRLYLDHDFSGDEKNLQGCACKFPLGIRQNVDRYIDQFRDLFTEEGRRLVKITTSKPGQPEQVVYTAIQTASTAQATATSITITSAQALLKQATSMAASIASQGETSGASLAAKRNIPIQLSLSITPVSGTPSIIPAAGTNQVSVTIPGQSIQSQASSQRLKQLGLHQRATPSPMTSPASTPTSMPQQIAAAIVGQQASLQKVPTPTPTPTPPPNSRTPTPTQHPAPSLTPTSVSSRRSSAAVLEGLTGGQGSQQTVQQAQNISFVTQGVPCRGQWLWPGDPAVQHQHCQSRQPAPRHQPPESGRSLWRQSCQPGAAAYAGVAVHAWHSGASAHHHDQQQLLHPAEPGWHSDEQLSNRLISCGLGHHGDSAASIISQLHHVRHIHHRHHVLPASCHVNRIEVQSGSGLAHQFRHALPSPRKTPCGVESDNGAAHQLGHAVSARGTQWPHPAHARQLQGPGQCGSAHTSFLASATVARRSAVHPAPEPAAATEGWTAEDRNADRCHNVCPAARGPQQAGGRQLHRRASLHSVRANQSADVGVDLPDHGQGGRGWGHNNPCGTVHPADWGRAGGGHGCARPSGSPVPAHAAGLSESWGGGRQRTDLAVPSAAAQAGPRPHPHPCLRHGNCCFQVQGQEERGCHSSQVFVIEVWILQLCKIRLFSGFDHAAFV